MAKDNRTNPGDAQDPENQVNPKWAQQIEAAAEKLSAAAASLHPRLPVAEREFPVEDRKSWTTPEEAEAYDNMVGKDFFKLDADKKPVKGANLYRITHVYPEFQTANAGEFKARFVVEEFHWEKQKGQQNRRVVSTSFSLYAKDFQAAYSATTPDPVAVEA